MYFRIGSAGLYYTHDGDTLFIPRFYIPSAEFVLAGRLKVSEGPARRGGAPLLPSNVPRYARVANFSYRHKGNRKHIFMYRTTIEKETYSSDRTPFKNIHVERGDFWIFYGYLFVVSRTHATCRFERSNRTAGSTSFTADNNKPLRRKQKNRRLIAEIKNYCRGECAGGPEEHIKYRPNSYYYYLLLQLR